MNNHNKQQLLCLTVAFLVFTYEHFTVCFHTKKGIHQCFSIYEIIKNTVPRQQKNDVQKGLFYTEQSAENHRNDDMF